MFERPHPIQRKGHNDMKRTYVLNFVFKFMAVSGIICVLGTAGMSDFGSISNAQIFIQGGISFLAACIGVWGATNCTRAIEASKLRAKRALARKRRNVVTFPSAA